MKHLFFLWLILSTGVVFGQTFEGTLTYVSEFEVEEKMIGMGVTKEVLLDKMEAEGSWSDTIKTTYKNGDYLTVLSCTPKTWSIYKSEANKIYGFQEGEASDICSVTDAGVDLGFKLTGKKPSVEKLDTTVEINGTACNVVRVTWGTGFHEYVYDPNSLKVNPELFSEHVYDGWAEYIKISKALPIRIIKGTPGLMTVTMNMVSVKKEEVSSDIFFIPKLKLDKKLSAVMGGRVEIMKIKK